MGGYAAQNTRYVLRVVSDDLDLFTKRFFEQPRAAVGIPDLDGRVSNCACDNTDRVAKFDVKPLDHLTLAAFKIFGQPQQSGQPSDARAIRGVQSVPIEIDHDVAFTVVAH